MCSIFCLLNTSFLASLHFTLHRTGTAKSPPPDGWGHVLFLIQKPWARPLGRTPVPEKPVKFENFQISQKMFLSVRCPWGLCCIFFIHFNYETTNRIIPSVYNYGRRHKIMIYQYWYKSSPFTLLLVWFIKSKNIFMSFIKFEILQFSFFPKNDSQTKCMYPSPRLNELSIRFCFKTLKILNWDQKTLFLSKTALFLGGGRNNWFNSKGISIRFAAQTTWEQKKNPNCSFITFIVPNRFLSTYQFKPS